MSLVATIWKKRKKYVSVYYFITFKKNILIFYLAQPQEDVIMGDCNRQQGEEEEEEEEENEEEEEEQEQDELGNYFISEISALKGWHIL